MAVPSRAIVTAMSFCFSIAPCEPAAQEARSGVPRDPGDRVLVHVLNRLGFGPTRESLEQMRRTGIPAYIEEQLHPERIADANVGARLAAFTTLHRSSRDLAEEIFVPAQMARRRQQRPAGRDGSPDTPPDPVPRSPGQAEMMRRARAPIAELSQQKVLRAAYSDRQLQEVLVDFWFNHFNVFVGKGQVRVYLTEYERDVIRPHVLGSFRDLLGASARSPAMLFYLDNWLSTAAADRTTTAQMSSARGRVGRRYEQQLRRGRASVPQPDRMDPMRPFADAPAGPRRRGLNENYARELLELHTLGVDAGYTQKDVQEVARAFTGWTIANPRQGGSFRFQPGLHDDGEKMVLGRRIPGGGGQHDGEMILDMLAQHPSTARHIATKLARRFVADDPPAGLVTRAAERFRQTGGDLREVVRAIVTSPEFFAKEAYRAKVKSPFEFVVSAVRAAGFDAPSALPLVQSVRDLGMPLYGAQAPTGYPDRAEAWINSGALLNRMNFALALANGHWRGPARAGMSAERPAAADAVAQTLVATALAGDVSDSTAAIVAKASTPPQTVALIIGSPEFQKR